MTPEELVLTIVDMHQRHAPMATIFTVAARALRGERERCALVAVQEAVPAKETLAGVPDRQWAAELQAEIEMALGIAAAIRALD